jgi:hypothetical protein
VEIKYLLKFRRIEVSPPSLPKKMGVKIRRETEEPSTQRRTKARHDPAALRAVQGALGQEGS